MTITVSGTIVKPGGNEAWAAGIVKVFCKRFFTDGVSTFPQYEHPITLDGDGAFSVILAVPDSGYAVYEWILPSGESFSTRLSADDDPATLEALVAGAGSSPSDQDTTQTIVSSLITATKHDLDWWLHSQVFS